ncbi:MAG: hypothetical protein ACQEXJ_11625 [Myxococcota bacterium]
MRRIRTCCILASVLTLWACDDGGGASGVDDTTGTPDAVTGQDLLTPDTPGPDASREDGSTEDAQADAGPEEVLDDIALEDAGPDAADDADATEEDAEPDALADTADAVDASDAKADVPDTSDAGDGTLDGGDAADVEVDAGPDPVAIPWQGECDNLNPRFCVLPWPSDRYLAEDPTTPTGHRVAYDPGAIPETASGDVFDVGPYARLDGFSPSSQIVTLFDEPADLTGVAGPGDIGASLAADHPTVILDLETGDRIPHWVEVDARAESPDATLLYLRPADRLEPDRAYGVAIRDLQGLSGEPIEASAAFEALRDGLPTDQPLFEDRRPGFEDLFDALAEASVERETLQTAWRFHTASNESVRRDLLDMRADALERLGPDGIGCTVETVEDDYKGIARRRVRGTYTVPWYMTTAAPPGEIARDEDGVPVFQGVEEVEFTAIVPKSLADANEAGRLITWGHGLFGEAEGTISHSGVLNVAEDYGQVIVATDWAGMSKKDLGFLATALVNLSDFYMVGEWVEQGMINQIALTRTFLGACGEEAPFRAADGGPVIQPTEPHFVGGSQGSILGGTLLTISPDISRGALIVGGATFSFMIERSIHFNTFEPLLAPAYDSRLDVGVLMALSQHVWDRGETAAWLGASDGDLPGIGPKEYVYLIAENDAQVHNLSSDIAARIAGLPVLEASVRKPWGVPVVSAPYEGSVFVSMDLGDPPLPEGNIAPEEDAGGHADVGFTPEARDLMEGFLQTGVAEPPCGGAVCDLGP